VLVAVGCMAVGVPVSGGWVAVGVFSEGVSVAVIGVLVAVSLGLDAAANPSAVSLLANAPLAASPMPSARASSAASHIA